MENFILAASILAADFARLEAHCREALDAGADCLHIDVMDGHFVPNISFGPLVVNSLRKLRDEKKAFFDVHLMIANPDQYLEAFARAGADRLIVHVEAAPDPRRTVQAIKALGLKAGVTLKPATPLDTLEGVLPDVDLALIMSVNPGFGGQAYLPASTDKIKHLRGMLNRIGSRAWLEVDGGIYPENIAEVVNAGATVIVAGSSVFGGLQSVAENIAALRKAVNGEQ